MKDEFASTGCGIDVLLKALKPYSLVMKLSYGVNEVSEGASQPIKSPYNERIPFS